MCAYGPDRVGETRNSSAAISGAFRLLGQVADARESRPRLAPPAAARLRSRLGVAASRAAGRGSSESSVDGEVLWRGWRSSRLATGARANGRMIAVRTRRGRAPAPASPRRRGCRPAASRAMASSTAALGRSPIAGGAPERSLRSPAPAPRRPVSASSSARQMTPSAMRIPEPVALLSAARPLARRGHAVTSPMRRLRLKEPRPGSHGEGVLACEKGLAPVEPSLREELGERLLGPGPAHQAEDALDVMYEQLGSRARPSGRHRRAAPRVSHRSTSLTRPSQRAPSPAVATAGSDHAMRAIHPCSSAITDRLLASRCETSVGALARIPSTGRRCRGSRASSREGTAVLRGAPSPAPPRGRAVPRSKREDHSSAIPSSCSATARTASLDRAPSRVRCRRACLPSTPSPPAATVASRHVCRRAQA